MALPIFIFTEYSPQRRSRKANLLVQMRARNRAVCSIFRKLKTLSTPLHQCSSSLLQCSDGGRYAPPQRGYEFKTILPVFLKVGPCGLNVLPHHLGGQRKQTSAPWLVLQRLQAELVPSRHHHAKGMETVPFARLRLRVWTLDSVRSSPCSSDFLSAMLDRKRRVTESHSSGSSRSRKPRQMMQVAARRTTLKITSCFRTSTARGDEGREEGSESVEKGGGENENKLRLITQSKINHRTMRL